MLPHITLGIIGATIATVFIGWIATRWNRRPAAAYGVPTLFLFSILYIGLLQTVLLNWHPGSAPATQMQPETLYLAYAGVSALAAAIATVLLMAACMAVIRPGTPATGRGRAVAKAALLSLAISAVSAPFLIQNQITIQRAIAANQAEVAALRTSYSAGIERLVKLGIIRKIEEGDDAVTHFVTAPLFQLGAKGMAEYAKASLIYHIYVTGGEPKPIVLRHATTTQRIGTYYADGRFVLDSDFDAMKKAAIN